MTSRATNYNRAENVAPSLRLRSAANLADVSGLLSHLTDPHDQDSSCSSVHSVSGSPQENGDKKVLYTQTDLSGTTVAFGRETLRRRQHR
jgi:hypothetical protein